MAEFNEQILKAQQEQQRAQQERQRAFQQHHQEQQRARQKLLRAQQEQQKVLLEIIEKLASRQLETNKRVQQLAEDYQRDVRLKKDSKNIDESGASHTKKVRYDSSAPKTSRPEKTSSSPKKREKVPSNAYQRCGSLYWHSDCDHKNRKNFNCEIRGHKSSHFRRKFEYIQTIKMDGGNSWKYVPTQILGRRIRLQIDSGSDLTVVNLQTWKKLQKPTLLRTNENARSVTRERFKLKGIFLASITLKTHSARKEYTQKRIREKTIKIRPRRLLQKVLAAIQIDTRR